MQHTNTFTGRRAPLAALLASLLLAGVGNAYACGENGEPCNVGEAPAVQKPASAPNPGVGNPINVISGNKYQKEVDLPALPGVLGLEIVRHYNSAAAGSKAMPGPVGRGWRLSYETTLAVIGNSIEITQADGSVVVFGRDLVDPRVARHSDPTRGSIAISSTARGDEYLWTWNDGRKLSFNKLGLLVQIQAATGEILTLQHDARGLLSKVTDPQGRSMRLNWLDSETAAAGDRFRGVQSIDTPAGRFSYGYGSAAPKGAVVDPRILLSNMVKVSFPAAGGLVRTRRYHYEDGLHPTLMTGISIESVDAAGKHTSTRYATYAYRGDGKAVLSTHANDANKVTLDFGTPNQTTLTNSLGATTVYRYATIGGEPRLLEVRGAGCSTCSGNNMRYQYDKQGRLVEQTVISASGVPLSGTRRELDAAGRPVGVSSVAYVQGKAQPAVWQLRYEYASASATLPTVTLRPSVIPGKTLTTTVRYNSIGQALAVTESGWSPDPAGKAAPQPITRTTSFGYRTINGRSLLAEVDGPIPNGKLASPADSDITRYEYDATGSVVVRTTAPGNIVTEVRERDAALRATAARTSDGMRTIETENVYDYRGMPLTLAQRATVQAGRQSVQSRQTTFVYDAAGRMAAVTKPDRVTMRTEFDDSGRPSALIDPKGNRVQSRFDSEGRLIAVVTEDPQGAVLNAMLHLWDSSNNLRASIAPTGLVAAQAPLAAPGATLQHDGGGNASATITVGGKTDVQAADGSARQLVTGRDGMVFFDGARRAHAIMVDDFGRVVAEVAPDEGSFAYTFGANTVEKRHTSKDGKQVALERMVFSGAGRLIERTLAGCIEKLSYEGELLVRLAGCGSTEQYVRNGFGQIIEQRQSIAREGGGDPLTFTHGYTYDDATGQLRERRLPDGQRLAYVYDKIDGSAKALTRDSGLIAWFDRYLGRRAAAAVRAMLPASMTDDTVLADVTWRPFGGIASVTAGNGIATRLSYDTAGRLRALDIGSGAKPIEALRYQYDGAGNLVASSRNEAHSSYRYDAMHRLTAEQLNAPQVTPVAADASPAGALFAASYDPHGRRLGDMSAHLVDGFGRQIVRGKQELAYDDAGRLVAVSAQGRNVARYRYDVQGNRIVKTVGGRSTYFLYDNSRHLVAEIDDSGAIASQYLYVDNMPVAVLRAEGSAQTRTLYAIHTDHRGLPLAVTDTDARTVWRGQFDAFGNARPAAPLRTADAGERFEVISSAYAAAPAFDMPLRMAGQYADAETGLYYNVHRYYDPQQGRYITPDPTGLAGGENAYQYAGSDPMGRIDPLGLFEIPKLFIEADPFAYSIFGNPLSTVPKSDGGHGDIIKIAFNQYQRANPGRFSAHTIDWIIRNVYHSDANGPNCLVIPGPFNTYPTAPWTAGGGQCNAQNHYDNPNDGPIYKEKVNLDDPDLYNKRTDAYKDGKDDFWIADTVSALASRRNDYNKVVGTDISFALSAFGQNMHATADFYAHSNWVDASDRGGEVKTNYETKDKDGKVVKGVECGWIPPGLNMSRVWDGGTDDINYAYLYTGTVAGPGYKINKVCGLRHDQAWNYGDIGCKEDETTHGYWNKDHDGLAPGEKPYTKAEIDSFRQQGLYYWELEAYNPKATPGTKANPGSGFGTTWYGEFGVAQADLKKGDMIYVRKDITNRHEMAMTLAILDTQREIDKLFKNSANVKVGNFTLAEVFNMTLKEKDDAKIKYNGKHSKL